MSQRGEVSIEISGKTYRLVMDINAIVLLEELMGTDEKPVTFPMLIDRVNKGSVKAMRAFLWAALQKHHDDVTLQRAGELIQAAGGLEGFGRQLKGLVESATPDPADLKDLGAGPREAQAGKKARRGTGGGSTSTPDASA